MVDVIFTLRSVIGTAIITALIFIIALSWRETIQDIIEKAVLYFDVTGQLKIKVIASLTITILAIIFIVLIRCFIYDERKSEHENYKEYMGIVDEEDEENKDDKNNEDDKNDDKNISEKNQDYIESHLDQMAPPP